MRKRLLSKLHVWLLVLLCFSLQAACAQRSVSGRFTDERGSGISGVTVCVKATSTATQTGANGKSTLSAPESGVLVFTSVRYGTREVNVCGTSSFDVSLVAQNQSMQEVVVIGYGTARRKDVTGSVSSVSAREFNRGVQTSPHQLI